MTMKHGPVQAVFPIENWWIYFSLPEGRWSVEEIFRLAWSLAARGCSRKPVFYSLASWCGIGAPLAFSTISFAVNHQYNLLSPQLKAWEELPIWRHKWVSLSDFVFFFRPSTDFTIVNQESILQITQKVCCNSCLFPKGLYMQYIAVGLDQIWRINCSTFPETKCCTWFFSSRKGLQVYCVSCSYLCILYI